MGIASHFIPCFDVAGRLATGKVIRRSGLHRLDPCKCAMKCLRGEAPCNWQAAAAETHRDTEDIPKARL